MDQILLGFVLLLVLGAEFINGWTDAPNAIATVISTRTLSPKIAILMAALLNMAGAFFGTAVAATIATGIVEPQAIDLHTISAALTAVILWGLIAWRFGLPTSKSHALIAGLAGSSLAVGGPSVLLASGWIKVFIGLFFSTLLGLAGGWALAKFIQIFFSHSNPAPTRRIFGHLQVLSSAAMSFSHGSNDGQKFIGIFSLSLLLGGVIETFHVPFWVIVICSITMGLGTSIGGMRIIRTMGYKMVKLETYQGFSAETAAASTILLASSQGIPLSTTHTISTAIMGVGVAKRSKAVHWNVVVNIVLAWLLTFPLCGIIAFFAARLFQFIGLIGT